SPTSRAIRCDAGLRSGFKAVLWLGISVAAKPFLVFDVEVRVVRPAAVPVHQRSNRILAARQKQQAQQHAATHDPPRSRERALGILPDFSIALSPERSFHQVDKTDEATLAELVLPIQSLTFAQSSSAAPACGVTKRGLQGCKRQIMPSLVSLPGPQYHND